MSAFESLTEVFAEGGHGDNAERFARELLAEHRAEVLAEQGPGEHETFEEAAQMYRSLRPVIEGTMIEPDRWDGDESEDFHLARYVEHIAAQLTLASEFRVPLPEGLGGGYGEVVVQRESAGSDRWAVTDGAVSGLQAYIDGAGWRHVSEVGRDEAYSYSLDEALDIAEYVARELREEHDARIRAHRKAGGQQ